MYKAGLILEGGGMRGIFTAGVLDFFMEKNLEFEEVIGVSAGAIHATSYLSNQPGRSKAANIEHLREKRYCSLHNLIKTGNLFETEYTYNTIPQKLNVFDFEAFKNSPMTLYATVSDIELGKPDYIELHDMETQMDSLRASASLPLVSQIVEINGKKYLDGGMTDSIPLKKSEENGYEKNVVVMTQPWGYRKSPNKASMIIKRKYMDYPKMVDCILRRHIMYNKTLSYIEEKEKAGNVFVIRPPEKLCVGRIEKNKEKMLEAYDIGYRTAQKKFDKMIAFLDK